ncbi:hypothetical protein K9N68_31995 [Kovacikia minuta CCNUW1]|uniref:hypothetical protein n=1 Tax=Kovacikia minuta TaxID=2931930 RepID=UPI001CC9BF42|nr:hypothetical protein [Kovacikia minuta]UBF26102.1 hypothetical protein K9N68_31995 [Kovacikia minuta CCNUW1]
MNQQKILGLVFALLLLPTGAIAREKSPQPLSNSVQSGQLSNAVPVIQSQVQKRSANRWLVFGKVQNQTGRTIKNAVITLEITSGKRAGQMLTAKIRPTLLTHTMDGGFQASVYSPEQQPSFRLVSVQWQYEDHSTGVYP